MAINSTELQVSSHLFSVIEKTRFETIYAEHFSTVWRVVRGVGVRESQIDDVVQETFITVHQKLSTFESRSTLRTWILGIALNVARYHMRGYTRTAHYEVNSEVEPAEVTVDHATQIGNILFVRKVLSGLPVEKREILILSEMEGLTVPEIASILNINLNTAYTRVRVARAELLTAMSNRAPENSKSFTMGQMLQGVMP